MEQDVNYWIDLFDEVGGSYDTAQPLDLLRKETVERALADVHSGRVAMPSLDLEAWCRTQFAQHVMAERQRRSNHLVRDLDYLLDGFAEDGTYVDPLLSQVHRLGDGSDKVLRLWTIDDWHEWAYRRLEAAADASAAAHQANQQARRMIERLRAAHVTVTGDLYTGR